MVPLLIIPGYGDSGPEHWQSRWQALEPTARRLAVPDWEQPELEAWIQALDTLVAAAPAPPLLVAHSLGVLLVVHWSRRSTRAIHAAFLVAPPDPEAPAFPAVARGFAEPLDPASATGHAPLPFRSLVVGSDDDPYATPSYTLACARRWGSDLVTMRRAGHINTASGLGLWREGLAMRVALEVGPVGS